jgi:hypothetical protein
MYAYIDCGESIRYLYENAKKLSNIWYCMQQQTPGLMFQQFLANYFSIQVAHILRLRRRRAFRMVAFERGEKTDWTNVRFRMGFGAV